MKPAWDKLGDEYAGSASVLIADVDCTVHSDTCGDNDVRGYPTIKYWTQETGRTPQDYNGGRDFESLNEFVQDKLGKKCDVSSLDDCNEKQSAYITKMKGKDKADLTKELERLKGMAGAKVAADKLGWINQRVALLHDLSEL